MITRLGVKNFKSIKNLELECKRVNVFIGEPNVGKSNLLERLGLLSFVPYGTTSNLRKFVRFENIANLFYDDLIDHPVEIKGNYKTNKGKDEDFELSLEFNQNEFRGMMKPGNYPSPAFTSNYQGFLSKTNWGYFSFVKFYRYSHLDSFPDLQSDSLLPPEGTNLFSLVKARTELRQYLVDLFGNFGFRPMLKVQDHEIEMAKDTGELLFSYPYVTISDTLKRMIFYVTAIKSNKDSTIIFEEPESNSFPFYTKDLAEKIGQDPGNNQYFLSTHNPYFLEPLVEKTPSDDMAVFLVHFKDYETRVKNLGDDNLSELLEMDPFLNLDRFVE
jgi:predicted ATPase